MLWAQSTTEDYIRAILKWRSARLHHFHSLGQDQTTVTQQAEINLYGHSLMSCMWAHFPDRFPYHVWTALSTYSNFTGVNLPPALLAEWLKPFTFCSGNAGVGWMPIKNQHRFLTLDVWRHSSTASARDWTCDLLIMSSASYQLSCADLGKNVLKFHQQQKWNTRLGRMTMAQLAFPKEMATNFPLEKSPVLDSTVKKPWLETTPLLRPLFFSETLLFMFPCKWTPYQGISLF